MENSDQLFLNLEDPLPSDLKEKFDVVLNHTTLEHVLDLNTAIDNLCELTRDLLVVIVPFIQVQHWTKGSFE